MKKIDSEYENAIISLIKTQSAIESFRDDLPLLDSAIPQKPNLNQIVAEVQSAGEKNT